MLPRYLENLFDFTELEKFGVCEIRKYGRTHEKFKLFSSIKKHN